jgi:hypothetical protein
MDSHTTLASLKTLVRKFCEDRDWDQFHGAKDLAIGAIADLPPNSFIGGASELLEHFRFKSDKEIEEMFKNKAKREEIEDLTSEALA